MDIGCDILLSVQTNINHCLCSCPRKQCGSRTKQANKWAVMGLDFMVLSIHPQLPAQVSPSLSVFNIKYLNAEVFLVGFQSTCHFSPSYQPHQLWWILCCSAGDLLSLKEENLECSTHSTVYFNTLIFKVFKVCPDYFFIISINVIFRGWWYWHNKQCKQSSVCLSHVLSRLVHHRSNLRLRDN